MKITYLAHSGFLVETASHVLVFDYMQGDLQKALNGKEPVFFVSHSHDDHFSHAIFSVPNKGVVASYETPLKEEEQAVIVHPGDMVEIDGCKVQVFGSTDLGVSYLVKVDGESIFHAGDFNYWHWKEVSSATEVRMMTYVFQRELAPMLPYAGQIDVCFFPVDPRLGKDCGEGAELFAEKMQPKALVPMHFLGMEKQAAEYARKLKTDAQVLLLTESLQSVCFPA